LVGLVRQLQEENRNLAGQLGFVQAQLQQARETIRLLQAPPPEAVDGGGGVVIEAATEDLAREREAAAAEQRRPWWRFW
jgi:hypothetical protein